MKKNTREGRHTRKAVKITKEEKGREQRGRGGAKRLTKKWEDRGLGRGRGGGKRSEAGRLMTIPLHVTMIEWRDRAALSRMSTVPSCLLVRVLVQISAREKLT